MLIAGKDNRSKVGESATITRQNLSPWEFGVIALPGPNLRQPRSSPVNLLFMLRTKQRDGPAAGSYPPSKPTAPIRRTSTHPQDHI